MVSPYDNKDCTGWDLSGKKDMNGLTIHGLCLSNETPNAQVLPADLTGTTFIDCNLDNVSVPPGNTLINCLNRSFAVQDDGEDWIIHQDIPVAPLNEALFERLGISTNPNSIVVVDDGTNITTEVSVQLTQAYEDAMDKAVSAAEIAMGEVNGIS